MFLCCLLKSSGEALMLLGYNRVRTFEKHMLYMGVDVRISIVIAKLKLQSGWLTLKEITSFSSCANPGLVLLVVAAPLSD